MRAHSVLTEKIRDHCNRLLRRVDDLKRLMVAAEKLAKEDLHRWQFLTREARGAAVVGVMAELEALTKFAIQETHRAINASTLTHKELRKCMRQLAAHDAFESLRAVQDHSKLWSTRSFTTTLEGCADLLALPIPSKGPQPPLDGKTLKPEHFNRLWLVYGLPDVAFPSASWSSALQKMALIRNDVAHGNMPFTDIFSQAGRTTSEIEGYIDDVSSFAIHFVEQWCEYLDKEQYLSSRVAEIDA
ncbi:HEPN domain-containing protein [Micromonospora sp. GCM10011542]|uniref:HEPN domain-containing protein n=1 Tax=Micromonospora sp. GCM10011542 TaxID=3317337 RepID=UPI003612F994